MTIDEAIQTLVEYEQDIMLRLPTESRGAIELGIEALKREKEYRATRGHRTFDLLPGETEE